MTVAFYATFVEYPPTVLFGFYMASAFEGPGGMVTGIAAALVFPPSYFVRTMFSELAAIVAPSGARRITQKVWTAGFKIWAIKPQ